MRATMRRCDKRLSDGRGGRLDRAGGFRLWPCWIGLTGLKAVVSCLESQVYEYDVSQEHVIS